MMIELASEDFADMAAPRPVTPTRPSKTVQWSTDISVIPNKPAVEFYDDSELWYAVSELERFRDDARSMCRSMRSDGSNSGRCRLAHENTRGLEQRSCLERQRRKFLTLKYVVKAHNSQQFCADKLAVLAHRCSAWASVIAVEEAARDFVRAYAEEDEWASGKRSLDSEDVTERNVRRRIAA